VRGHVQRTLLRGTTVYVRADAATRRAAADDSVRAQRGGGQLLVCGQPDLLGWSGTWPDEADVVEQRCVTTLGPALDGETAHEPTEPTAEASEAGQAAEADNGVEVAPPSERKRPRE
jgi:hypothetical protein